MVQNLPQAGTLMGSVAGFSFTTKDTSLSAKRNLKANRRDYYDIDEAANVQSYFPAKRNSRPEITPKNQHQVEYVNAMRTSTITFGVGPAGTGKTLLAATFAADQLIDKEKSKLYLVRPAIESGATLGLLPGTLEEKYEPYLMPVREYLIERMGKGAYETALKNEKIVPQPIGYMRGMTFKDCVVILDEAQNITPAEMKMFLTRVGENCVVIVNGDIDQCDLPGVSGLQDAVERVDCVSGITVVEFDDSDCLRSRIVKDILRAYRD